MKQYTFFLLFFSILFTGIMVIAQDQQQIENLKRLSREYERQFRIERAQAYGVDFFEHTTLQDLKTDMFHSLNDQKFYSFEGVSGYEPNCFLLHFNLLGADKTDLAQFHLFYNYGII